MYIFQTDTVIGIGADATNCNDCEKLNIIKEREIHKPLQVIFSDIDMILKFVELNNDSSLKVIKQFLPGPFTFILDVKPDHKLCKFLTPQNKLGIRIPDHKDLLNWIKKIGRPIAATSANLHGQADSINLEDLPDKFLKTGQLVTETFTKILKPGAQPSGIIELQSNGFKVIRYHPAVEEFKTIFPQLIKK